ncbi:MAG: hypothetical protein IKN04_23965 [Clostridia bacterium]|nr:hypothetical protein [Clostridia bacterium]MBR6187170.1 hypothetical protein [Clostridia bacterium]
MRAYRFKRFLKAMAILFAALAVYFYANHPAQAPVDPGAADPESTQVPSASVLNQSDRVTAGCDILQTMGFSRCGHSVTRRIETPNHLIGADFAAVQAYYELWQIDSFSKDHIAMSREIPLFCPMHTVISVDDAGNAVLCQNMYGDGMAIIKTTDLSIDQFDAETREALLLGIGFDSQTDAEVYLNGLSS